MANKPSIVPGMDWKLPVETLERIREIEDNLRTASGRLAVMEFTVFGHSLARPGTFEWALIQMKAGKRVRLGDFIFWLDDEIQAISGTHLPTGTTYDDGLVMKYAQIRAIDWQIYEEG